MHKNDDGSKTGCERCSFCSRDKSQVKNLVSGDESGVFICNDCVGWCHKALNTKDVQQNDNEGSDGDNDDIIKAQYIYKPEEIYKYLDEHVIGQKDAKKILSVAAYNHYKRISYNAKSDDVEISKSNVLLIGPTGSGKTLLVQTLARMLHVPFAMADATTLTETGYIGDDVESVLHKLLIAANFDVDRASRGIVYIDEVDKIARKIEGLAQSSSPDISREGVQQALLTMIEGATVSVSLQNGRRGANSDSVQMNTSKILFIFSGAFGAPLLNAIASRLGGSSMGFGVEIRNVDSYKYKNLIEHIDSRDLIKYGLIPELVGRIPIIATLDELDINALVDILSKPKNAILKQYSKLFEMEDVELDVTEEAMHAIAEQTLKKHSGARGLRAIMEKLLLEIMFEMPHNDQLSKVIITTGTVKLGHKAVLIDKNGNQIKNEDDDDKVCNDEDIDDEKKYIQKKIISVKKSCLKRSKK